MKLTAVLHVAPLWICGGRLVPRLLPALGPVAAAGAGGWKAASKPIRIRPAVCPTQYTSTVDSSLCSGEEINQLDWTTVTVFVHHLRLLTGSFNTLNNQFSSLHVYSETLLSHSRTLPKGGPPTLVLWA